MIDGKNFKILTPKQKRREIEKGFIHALQRQIQLDELLSNFTNYKVMINWYVRVVAFNIKLRVYAQLLIRSSYPSAYQDPPQHITVSHFQDYCANTLAVLEQLKKNNKRKVKLSTINMALDDIISKQQKIFDYLKAAN